MRADRAHNPVKFSSKAALFEPSYEQVTVPRSQLLVGANYLDPTVLYLATLKKLGFLSERGGYLNGLTELPWA